MKKILKNTLGYAKTPMLYRKGLALYRQKKWVDALPYFKEAHIKFPNHAASTFKLGLCYLKLKELHEAEFYLKKAIDQAPNNKHWKTQLKQCKRQIDSSTDTHASSLKRNIVRINQGVTKASLGVNLKKKLLLIPSDYNHRVMADISPFIKYYKDFFEIYIILRNLDLDIIHKSTHTLIKNGTSYGEFFKVYCRLCDRCGHNEL